MSVSVVIRRFSSDKHGTTAVLFALMSVPVISIMGIAIDYARAISVSNRLQASLDAAVLAAADADPALKASIAQQYFTLNFQGGGKIAAGAVSTTFGVDGNGNMTGTATADVSASIMQILQVDKLTVAVSASAKPTEVTTTTTTNTVTTTVTVPGSTPCIHVMDQSGARTLKLLNNSNLDARNCEIHVRSNSSDAIQTENENNVKWKRLLVKGVGGTTWGLLDTIMLAPNRIQYDSAVVADPYTRPVGDVISAIATGSCTTANTNKTYTNTTVSPGTYCGTTTFDGVTFQAGLYVVQTSGGNSGLLRMKGVLNGSAGVSFYFADGKSKINSYAASSGSVLLAPTTGTTRGLLFFENSNRGQQWDLTVADMTNTRLSGVIYLPSGNLSLAKWSQPTGSSSAFALICNRLTISQWSGVTNTYSWTPFNATSPINLPETTTTSTVTQESTSTSTTDGWLNR